MLSDEFPGSKSAPPTLLGGTTTNIFLYVENVDSLFNQAVQAGAEADMPPSDMFWGDRYAKLTDPFGHAWSIATHIEDVAPQEMERRVHEAMAKMARQNKTAG